MNRAEDEPKSIGGKIGRELGTLSAVLTIVFIVLKLIHVISWSWLWVLSPTWINLILLIAIPIIVIFVAKMNGRSK